MGLFDQFPYTNLHEINLDWILKTIKNVTDKIDGIELDIDAIEKEIKELSENLGIEVDKWLREQGAQYVQEIIAQYIATSVYFGITDSGYFVAYIPESWDSITFNTTGLDIDVKIQPQYGHLVLSY